jgi:hypothetical protein
LEYRILAACAAIASTKKQEDGKASGNQAILFHDFLHSAKGFFS